VIANGRLATRIRSAPGLDRMEVIVSESETAPVSRV